MNDKHQVAVAALILRLSLGTMLIAHGLLKVLVFTLPGSARSFLPPWGSPVGWPIQWWPWSWWGAR